MTPTPPTQYEAQMLHFAPQVIAELKAEIRRKDALLRKCLEAFEADDFMKKLNAASEIRKELQ